MAPVTCWVRPDRLLALLLLATAAAGWRFDPWSQQWVSEETKQQQPAQSRQGHAYQSYQQHDYPDYHAQQRQDTKTVECKKRNKAGRCLTKAERELLLPNGFALGFEPKVSFNLYDDPDMGSKYLHCVQRTRRENRPAQLVQLSSHTYKIVIGGGGGCLIHFHWYFLGQLDKLRIRSGLVVDTVACCWH